MNTSATRAKLDALCRTVDKVPDGWRPTSGWREICGLGETAMRLRLRKLVASGQADMRLFRVPFSDRIMPIPHYRIPAVETDRRPASKLMADLPSNPYVVS